MMTKKSIPCLLDKILESFAQLDALVETVQERVWFRGVARSSFEDVIPERSTLTATTAVLQQTLTAVSQHITNLEKETY